MERRALQDEAESMEERADTLAKLARRVRETESTAYVDQTVAQVKKTAAKIRAITTDDCKIVYAEWDESDRKLTDLYEKEKNDAEAKRDESEKSAELARRIDRAFTALGAFMTAELPRHRGLSRDDEGFNEAAVN